MGDALDQEVARFLEPFPTLVFLGVADPDVEIAADPRAGMKMRDFGLGGMGVEIIAEAAGFESGRLGQRLVEGSEERLAAVWEGFPGVFAVEDQRDNAMAGGRDRGDVLEIGDEMLDRVGSLVARGVEADEIGEGTLPEECLDRRAAGVNAPALEKLEMFDVACIPRRIRLEALEEVAFIRAKIIEPGLDHERDNLRRDGALRGPKPARALAEDPLMLVLGEAQLCPDVLRRGEGRGKR